MNHDKLLDKIVKEKYMNSEELRALLIKNKVDEKKYVLTKMNIQCLVKSKEGWFNHSTSIGLDHPLIIQLLEVFFGKLK